MSLDSKAQQDLMNEVSSLSKENAKLVLKIEAYAENEGWLEETVEGLKSALIEAKNQLEFLNKNSPMASTNVVLKRLQELV